MHRVPSVYRSILGIRARLAWGSRFGGALVTVLGLSGCMGGQTGSEATPDGGGCGVPQADANDTRGVATLGAICQPIQPNDKSRLGFSAVEAVEAIATLPALSLEWGSGEATTLTLGITESSATPCLEQSDSGAILKVPVDIALTTADGRLDSRLVGSLVAESMGDGGIAGFELSGSRVCQSGDMTSWAVECGTSELTQAGYTGLRVGLSARLQPAATGTRVLGTIQISGGLAPVCPTGSVLPCTATEWQTVQGASFGTQ
jgi:hypothetical protein